MDKGPLIILTKGEESSTMNTIIQQLQRCLQPVSRILGMDDLHPLFGWVSDERLYDTNLPFVGGVETI